MLPNVNVIQPFAKAKAANPHPEKNPAKPDTRCSMSIPTEAIGASPGRSVVYG